MTEAVTLNVLIPIIILLFLGVITAIIARALKISPIVGYIALGLLLKASGANLSVGLSTISVMANLGVVFLLFDIGLNFEFAHFREHATTTFGFGIAQVAFGAVGLGAAAMLFGLAIGPALLIGAVLALSSTAVVERVIAERHQLTCPVGQTAVAILVFQDVAAILLLIVANALEGGGQVGVAALTALLKAGAAVGVTILVSRLLVGPLLRLVARTRNDEVFTATALLIALAAGWATGSVGLSLTLGAFLAGLALAETPYRPVIASEIKPFRGLLLGFFFVSIGLSLDVKAIADHWLAVLAVTVLFTVIKILTNFAASRVFKWSIPGSTQLGFLLGQGSEFAFVILILPPVRDAVGPVNASILIPVVALSLAVTPTVAQMGRTLAGQMRRLLQQRQSGRCCASRLRPRSSSLGWGQSDERLPTH
jgi:monovalent cation:H+ antiporter-2, CPA2 family